METHRPTLISVVLPAYNESEGLPVVLSSIFGALAKTGFAHEIVVVDDGSTDGTRAGHPGHVLRPPQPALRPAFTKFRQGGGSVRRPQNGRGRCRDPDGRRWTASSGAHPDVSGTLARGLRGRGGSAKYARRNLAQAPFQEPLLSFHGGGRFGGHPARRWRLPAPGPKSCRRDQRASRSATAS